MMTLSVVMPVFNQEKFLAKTIESVLTQTFWDFEFLILDDGSTDNSAEIIRSYAERDKRIKSFFEPNAGKCLATNKLVEKAKGEFCAFLDADDLMLPERLEKQLTFHKHNPSIDASSCHCYYIDEIGTTLGKQRYPYLKTIEESRLALRENKIIHCAFTGLMTTRRAYLETGGLRSQFWPTEDLDFANRLIEEKYSLVIIQEVLMKYRVHSSSITSKKQWHMFDMGSYTRYCIKQRRAGKPEINFNEYLLIKEKNGLLKKVKEKMHRHSLILHKRAGLALYAKNYLSFCWTIIAALLLDPNYILATLRNRLNFNRIIKRKQGIRQLRFHISNFF